MRLNKQFEYKQACVDYSGGTIRVRLMGTFSSSEKVTTKGAPYELFVSFTSDTNEGDVLTVSDICLLDAATNKLVFRYGDVFGERFEPGSDGVYRAYVSIKDIDLRYNRYKIVVEFQVGADGLSTRENVELYLDKDYKEFRSNDLWDKLMSV